MTTSTQVRSGSAGSPSHGASSNSTETVETLKADIAKLTETVKSLASEQLSNVSDNVQDKAASTVTDIEAAIRKNPTQAAAVAAGIGFVIGLILTR